MPPQTIIRLRREAIFGDRIGLHLAHRHPNGDIEIAESMTVTRYRPEEVLCESRPLFHLDPTEAQHLIDELWHLGIRPTEGHGSTGQLAATERHLNHLTQLLDQSFGSGSL